MDRSPPDTALPFPARRPRLTLLLCLAATLAAAAGLPRLTFTTDSRVFFSADNPQLAALNELENTFSRDDNILFVLAPKDGQIFRRTTLEAVLWLTDQAWLLPYATRVASLTNHQLVRARGDDIVVADLVADAETLAGADLAALRRTALAEPLLVGRLLDPAATVTGVDVLVTRPGRSVAETEETVAAARDLAARFRARYPGIDLHLTGGVIIDHAFGEASRDDLTTLVPLMYLVLALLLAAILRSVVCCLATLAVIGCAMVSAMGLAGWYGLVLNPTTANAPTVILTLAVADSVHICVSLLRELGRGRPKDQAMARALAVNRVPVFLTSVTTAVGFLSMVFSDAPPFRELGVLVALGVAAALAYSLVLLPALLVLAPVRPGRRLVDNSSRWLAQGLAPWLGRHHRPVLWGSLLACIAAIAGMTKNTLDDDFVKYFDRSYEFRRATDFAQTHLTGFNVIEYKVPAAGPGGINDPPYLESLDRFAAWYRAQPKVAHVMTVADIHKRLNQAFHNDDPAWYRVPATRELAAQYLLLYEMSLPMGFDLNNMINVDKSASRMVVRVRNMSSRELRTTDQRAQTWLRANAPAIVAPGTGLSMIFSHISKRNIDAMLGASFGALGVISLLLAIIFRSLRYGLAALAPNLAPALMAFGIWGYTVGVVDLVVSVIAALTLGIVVDDTIHFLHRYLHARRHQGKTPPAAVAHAFATSGTAIWVTTVILVAGFAVLALSGFSLNRHMGMMCGLTIAIALALDYLLLPALLLTMDHQATTEVTP